MDIKYWTPFFVCLVLVTGTVEALADSGWHYDEDSDTVIFDYSGSPANQAELHTVDMSVNHAGLWYYDEHSDTIVSQYEGSRSHSSRTIPSEKTAFDYNLAFLDQ